MSEDRIAGETRAVEQTKAAVQDLIKGFQDYQGKIEAKLRVQEDRLTMLDRRAAGRPALSVAAETATPHRKAMADYIRSGDETGLRDLEAKALTTGSGGDGGMLLDGHTAAAVTSVLSGASSLRSVANVVQVEAASYEALVDCGDIDTVWASEAGTAVETNAEAFRRVSIPLHELSAMPRASQRLLEDSAFDVEAWLSDAIARRFSRAENTAFIKGTGVNMPTGVLSYPQAYYETASWGEIGVVTSGTDGTFGSLDPADALIDLVYSLGVKYRARAAFVMNSRTSGAVRKFKDVDGNFLWTESLCAGEPSRLMGHPVVINEDMPDIGVGTTPIAFGDFHAGYTIVERPGLRVLRDPFSVKPHVQFYASARIGGDVTDFSAIRLLQLSATV